MARSTSTEGPCSERSVWVLLRSTFVGVCWWNTGWKSVHVSPKEMLFNDTFPFLLVYEYLTKSISFIWWWELSRWVSFLGIQSSNPPQKPSATETLRRGMSIALNPNEKPAPPIRRTPSMNTANPPQQCNNGYIELQSRLKARLKRAEEIAGQGNLIQTQRSTTVMKTTVAAAVPSPSNMDDDFPPPPPEFLLTNEAEARAPPKSTSSIHHSSLLADIQRGGFKLRKAMTDRDRSAPRLKWYLSQECLEIFSLDICRYSCPNYLYSVLIVNNRHLCVLFVTCIDLSLT